MDSNLKVILTAVVDVIAIVGLIVLASLKVISADAVIPVIVLLAGASVGANVQNVRNQQVMRRSMMPPASPDAPAVEVPPQSPPPAGPGGAVGVIVMITTAIAHLFRGLGKS